MSDQPDRVAMLSDLIALEERLLQRIGGEADAAGRRFEHHDQRLDAIDGRFDAIDRKFDVIDGKFEAVDARFVRVEERIAEEGRTTRRYFEIIAERVESAVKLVAEVNSHHAVVLEDHEARLKTIEKRRG